MALGVSDLPAPLFPMHRREALAQGAGSRTDTMHIVITSVNSLLVLLAIAFGSAAFGKRFRVYSGRDNRGARRDRGTNRYAGAPARGGSADAVGGVAERTSIGGYLLWQAVLAIALLRAEAETQ